MENYNPNSEFALNGDEDGWVATHSDPAANSKTSEEEIPSIDDHVAHGPGAGAGKDDDIPDISELDLADDEVGDVHVMSNARLWCRFTALLLRHYGTQASTVMHKKSHSPSMLQTDTHGTKLLGKQ